MTWEISLHPEVEAWYLAICVSDPETADLVKDAIDQLAEEGPTARRPLVDRLQGSRFHNMKELRPPSWKQRNPDHLCVRPGSRSHLPGGR
jgi:hypothetical protein